MNGQKNPLLAFVLSFIPGAGFLYLNKLGRALFYSGSFFGSIALAVTLSYVIFGDFIILAMIGFFFWGVSIVDMVIYLIRHNHQLQGQHHQGQYHQEEDKDTTRKSQGNERFNTILLSLIPGLGHFHLGLMNRGLPFLVGFFGLITMIFFVTMLTRTDGFIVFLGLVPILWIYNIFDVMQLLKKKDEGIELEDKTILEDFEKGREEGRKSKAVTTLLAVIPGLGHMYLGLQRRGLQLMAAFLFAIYIIDVLRISLFLFIIPLIWFYSIFDAMQKSAKYGVEPVEDKPLVSYFVNHQRWIGIGLLLVGLYYFFDQVLLHGFMPFIEDALQIKLSYYYYNYFQTTIVCLLLVGGGIKLMLGSKKSKGVEEA
ncbi:hypothetical protein [Bacillus alkalicellulosilyticus]|uniref:hypothetical protein n=1 Tax=Alkalihalobacterium alkalicellulosilyticum TaxID=1912214 RepID=UPI0009980EC2|nr:hypothetical protein [Bacillus alkalicellulosilyticus]